MYGNRGCMGASEGSGRGMSDGAVWVQGGCTGEGEWGKEEVVRGEEGRRCMAVLWGGFRVVWGLWVMGLRIGSTGG